MSGYFQSTVLICGFFFYFCLFTCDCPTVGLDNVFILIAANTENKLTEGQTSKEIIYCIYFLSETKYFVPLKWKALKTTILKLLKQKGDLLALLS